MLTVAAPGTFTTVQDLGRRRRAAGVPPGGAMDRFALAAANLLVGNDEGAPALECTGPGPVLLAGAACLVAVTGGASDWASIFLAAGERLDLSQARGRTYVSLAGGVRSQRWLGSASTYVLVGRGGIAGRALQVGDVLEPESEPARPLVAGRSLPADSRPPYGAPVGLVRGPHWTRLAPESRKRLFSQEFVVAADSDRMAFRLEGEPVQVGGAELMSFGVATGCLQVPPSGEPILLMADHQTAGGYPVVGGAGRAWLPVAAQLLPGDRISFREVTQAQAQAEWRRLRSSLSSLRPS